MKRKVVNKKKFIKSILVILFILITFILIISSNFKNKEVISTECDYVVSKGETLWNIAAKYKQDNQDIRDYIYQIRKINNMETATIYEGQAIKVIVYEEAE